MRLLYFDPTGTYLVPRIVQSFHGSLEAQQQILDYTPDEKTTVLLLDFSDYGNAAAGAVPANTVLVKVAPVALTFRRRARLGSASLQR